MRDDLRERIWDMKIEWDLRWFFPIMFVIVGVILGGLFGGLMLLSSGCDLPGSLQAQVCPECEVCDDWTVGGIVDDLLGEPRVITNRGQKYPLYDATSGLEACPGCPPGPDGYPVPPPGGP